MPHPASAKFPDFTPPLHYFAIYTYQHNNHQAGQLPLIIPRSDDNVLLAVRPFFLPSQAPLEAMEPANEHRTYKSISPKTRMIFGGGIIAYALIAQTLSDQAESMFGLKATEQDRERLRESMPKIRSVDSEEG